MLSFIPILIAGRRRNANEKGGVGAILLGGIGETPVFERG